MFYKFLASYLYILGALHMYIEMKSVVYESDFAFRYRSIFTFIFVILWPLFILFFFIPYLNKK